MLDRKSKSKQTRSTAWNVYCYHKFKRSGRYMAVKIVRQFAFNSDVSFFPYISSYMTWTSTNYKLK